MFELQHIYVDPFFRHKPVLIGPWGFSHRGGKNRHGRPRCTVAWRTLTRRRRDCSQQQARENVRLSPFHAVVCRSCAWMASPVLEVRSSSGSQKPFQNIRHEHEGCVRHALRPNTTDLQATTITPRAMCSFVVKQEGSSLWAARKTTQKSRTSSTLCWSRN